MDNVIIGVQPIDVTPKLSGNDILMTEIGFIKEAKPQFAKRYDASSFQFDLVNQSYIFVFN